MSRPTPSLLPLLSAFALGILLLTAWRSSASSGLLPAVFTVGSTWHGPTGTEYRIEEVQGEWLRVTITSLTVGFPPSAVWVYAPTGATWSKN